MTGSLTVAVVLAAGSGTRFVGSTHKLLSVAQGRPVYHWAVESAIEASVGPVVVVTGKTPLPLDFALSDERRHPSQNGVCHIQLIIPIGRPAWQVRSTAQSSLPHRSAHRQWSSVSPINRAFRQVLGNVLQAALPRSQ